MRAVSPTSTTVLPTDASCQDGVNSFSCQYQCDHCEPNVDECSSSPCANSGTCNDGINEYNCLYIWEYWQQCA